jgi:hypothetical protein
LVVQEPFPVSTAVPARLLVEPRWHLRPALSGAQSTKLREMCRPRGAESPAGDAYVLSTEYIKVKDLCCVI